MFKLIPGTQGILVNYFGEFRSTDGEQCGLKVVNGKVNISLYGEERTVDLSWVINLARFEVFLPEHLQHLVWTAKFSEPFQLDIRSGFINIMSFEQPLEVFPGYRIVPGYSRYAVSKDGNVIYVASSEIVPVKNKQYEYTSAQIYDPIRRHTRTVVVHRLVALAWVENPEPEKKPYVNHINGNKHDPRATNLEWVSSSENSAHAVATGLRKDTFGCRLKDISTGQVVNYPSVTAALRHLGKSTERLFELRDRLIDDRYLIKTNDDTAPWLDDQLVKVNKNGYNIIVWYPDGTERHYSDTRDFLRAFKLWNVGTGIHRLIEKFEAVYPELRVTYVRNRLPSRVESLDVATGRVTKADTIKNLAWVQRY